MKPMHSWVTNNAVYPMFNHFAAQHGIIQPGFAIMPCSWRRGWNVSAS